MSRDLRESLKLECVFEAIRASGPGGQHVNTSSTKVRLRWSIPLTRLFDESQKAVLIRHPGLARFRNSEHEILISSQEFRSQLMNRDCSLDKLVNVLRKALLPEKPRVSTKVPKGTKRRRLEGKRRRSETKQGRRPGSSED